MKIQNFCEGLLSKLVWKSFCNQGSKKYCTMDIYYHQFLDFSQTEFRTEKVIKRKGNQLIN